MGVFKVGKHKGKNVHDVSEQYLVWYYENVSKDICSKNYYNVAKSIVLQKKIADMSQ